MQMWHFPSVKADESLDCDWSKQGESIGITITTMPLTDCRCSTLRCTFVLAIRSWLNTWHGNRFLVRAYTSVTVYCGTSRETSESFRLLLTLTNTQMPIGQDQ